MVDKHPVHLKETSFHGVSITNHGPLKDLLPLFRFTVGDFFCWDMIFLVWLQKVTKSGTRFLNAPNLQVSDQNLNFTGREMCAKGRNREAEVRGLGR